MKKASKLLWALLVMAALIFVGCRDGGGDDGDGPGGGGYQNPAESSTELQTFYIQVKDRNRTDYTDMSDINRFHMHVPKGTGFKIQKIFVSDTKEAGVPSGAKVWYDFTKGNNSTDYTVGNYGGTLGVNEAANRYGEVNNGLFFLDNETGIGPSDIDGQVYGGNLGLALDGKAYIGFIIANFSATSKFNNLQFEFRITNDLVLGGSSKPASFFFGIPDTVYTVTFDSNGGDTEANPKEKKVAPPATKIDALPTTAPERAGYTFDGWNTAEDGTGTTFDANTEVTASIRVYAKWTALSGMVVTFDKNGGTTNASPLSKNVVSPDTTIDALPTPPTWPGHNFLGWNTEANGTGTSFDETTPVTVAITVYAQWEAALTAWETVYYKIPADMTTLALHVNDGVLEIQKIFVNDTKTEAGADVLFDFADFNKDEVWWTDNGLENNITDEGVYAIASSGTYKAGGRCASPLFVDGEGRYIGFIIRYPETTGSGDARFTTLTEADALIDEFKFSDVGWETVYYAIPAGDMVVMALHVNNGGVKIQKIFVNTTATATGATYLYDFSKTPAYVAGNFWWGSDSFDNFVSGGKYVFESTSYQAGGRFGSSLFGDNSYIGFVIKDATGDARFLADAPEDVNLDNVKFADL